MTITFTDEARAHLDRYLRHVRSALSVQPSVDVSDVEGDIVNHIEAELAAEPQPVGALRLLQECSSENDAIRWKSPHGSI